MNLTEDQISQIPALQLLINMGYEYLSPSKAQQLRGGRTSAVLLEGILKSQLQKINRIRRKGKIYEFSESNINNAIRTIKELPLDEGYIHSNKYYYDLITLGKAFEQTIDGDKKSHTIKYIDWQTPENNVFHVTEEFSVLRTARTDTYRPDIVLFINGIPMVIMECKTPALNHTKSPTDLAVEQHLRNQKDDGIRDLYVYSNLLLSIATNEGKYATTGTPKQFWSKWKERFASKISEQKYKAILSDLKNQPLTTAQKKELFGERYQNVRRYFDEIETTHRPTMVQDELIYSLCEKERLLDLIHNFTLYDNGKKKVARYQQYFAVKDTMRRVTRLQADGKRKGGVIWHTQGSGKSLTMVMLAQMIASHPKISNPKIVLVTDRTDLDNQISDTFKKCQKEVQQAKTGKDLTNLLESNSDAIITTIINKFEAAVKAMKSPLMSSEIFVLIDEGHRTQYGTFNVSMQKAFPNACFLAFTGTPLMKKEKSTAKKFGGYIGLPYTVLDAVADGAVVPLLYEGRHNLITVQENAIDRYFEKLAIRENLTEYGKTALKKKFNTINEINKTDQVIYARAEDISEHYVNFFKTFNDRYKPKAQLVAPTIKTALLYKKYLDELGQVTSEVIVTRSDKRENTTDAYYGQNEEHEREERYFKALEDKYGNQERAEKNLINQFKHDERPEILIVVAKLLTGFDAPRNTVLYLCRSLKDHTLLQAIARVNRVHPGKDYGYIIDYFGNLENLDTAIDNYTGVPNFDKEDLEGSWTAISEEVKKLPQAHAEVWDIFKTMPSKKVEATVYQEHLHLDDLRYRFYQRLSAFVRLLKLALSSYDFVLKTDEQKIATYKKDAKFFLKLRIGAKRRFNDDISYKEYEPQVQQIINRHILTEGETLQITELVDIFNQDERAAEMEKQGNKAAQADHIASKTIKAINVKMEEDPVFYKKLAELIKETIEAYYQKRISEAEFLAQAKSYEEQFQNGTTEDAPPAFVNNQIGLAFYNRSKVTFENADLLKTNFHVEMGLSTDKVIQRHIYSQGQKIIDWQKNTDLIGKINIALGDELYDLLQKYDEPTDWDTIDNYVIAAIKVAKVRY